MSIDFIFDLLIRAFFGRGDSVVCHSELCLFVSGLYSKTHVSSPVITCSKKSGLPLTRSKSSREIEIRFSFCSSVKTLETNLAQSFRICNSVVTISWTMDFGSPTWSAINLTLRRWSESKTAFILATLSKVWDGDGRPMRWSFSTSSLPSLNTLCHLNTCAFDKASFPLAFCIIQVSRSRIFRV